MDFELDEQQSAILSAVEQLLARCGGAERARTLAAKDEYDSALERALEEAGFADVLLGEGTGPLEAAAVVEAVARAGGMVAAAAGVLVAPALLGRRVPTPVALGSAGPHALPVRFGAHARTLLLDAGERAVVVSLCAGEVVPVRSSLGYPMGRLPAGCASRGETLGRGSGERLRAWWRVALAAELAGSMEAALAVTLAHVKQRRQFGRAIGSFQAVQHRLAECKGLVEAARWLAAEAAWQGAPVEAAAAAAAHAADAAARVFHETHQLTGASGFTREHALHVWSLRLQALRLELGGAIAHRRALAEARWGAA